MFTAAKSPPHMVTLVLLTALSVLTLNMFVPSLNHMAADFSVDYGLMSVSVAGYLLMTAVLQLVMGPLSDRYGRRPVLLVGVAVFAIASVGCALATNIWVFLTFRMLQGAIISGNALSRAVIRDMMSAREAASMMGYVSMAMAVAPMLGPMFGGLLDQAFGWRASFVVFAVLGAIMLLICWRDLGETNNQPSETFLKQFQAYPELFRSRRFWGYSVCSMFSVGAFYAFIAGVPLVASTIFEMSPAELGFYLGSITIGFFVGTFISGRIAAKHSLASMMIAGRIVACLGLSVGLILLMLGYVHVLSLFGATVFVGLGNGLTIPSASAGALSVRPSLAGSASGLSGALIVGGGAVLTSLTASVVSMGNPAIVLLAMMLSASFIALLAAFYVRWVDKAEEI